MPFAVPRALPLSLLAAFVLAGCAEKGQPRLKRVKNHWMWQALCGKKCPPA
jgi:outer membrane biogenesis lipoprotein LolB